MVCKNPVAPAPLARTFEFLGFDLVDVDGDVSALLNCGGFPDVFNGSELSSDGLLRSRRRAFEVRDALRKSHPDERHADCDVWAIYRSTGIP